MKNIFILSLVLLLVSFALAEGSTCQTSNMQVNVPKTSVKNTCFDPYKCFNNSIGCLNLLVIIAGLIYAGKQLKSLQKIHADNHEWNRRIETQKILSKYEELSEKSQH